MMNSKAPEMGILEMVSQRKIIAPVVLLALIGVAAWWLMTGKSENAGAPRQAFFTDDDGKTYFSDDAGKVPPFERNGKPAYGAMVFTNDGGKTKYVLSMYRYTPEGKKQMEAVKQSRGGEFGRSALESIEVKKPGTGEQGWVRSSDPRAMEIQRPPNVPGGFATQVHPD